MAGRSYEEMCVLMKKFKFVRTHMFDSEWATAGEGFRELEDDGEDEDEED